MNAKSLGLLAALSANVIWAFMSIPLRLIQNYDANQILYYRIIISFIISGVLVISFNRAKLKSDFTYLKSLEKREYYRVISLIIASGILITLNWFAYIYVVNNINLKSAAFAYMICPLITALGGFLLLKEDLSKLKFIGIGVAVISILILAMGLINEMLWSVVTATFYAFFLIIQRRIKVINKLNMLALQLVVALLLIIPLLFIFPHPFPTESFFWVDMFVIALFFTVLPLLLSMIALISLPSSTVGILIYINPVVAFSVAFFYFDEKIQINQLFAYGLLLIAVIIFNFKVIKETYTRLFRKSLKIN